ncbi:hypothetical protein [Pseudomonas sp. NUPR-001]|uniref:hypothetical protein n=1 Tax=Pseudomonas sp. NUPR-001 TaxID=3416058 RepID=UPI003F9A8AD1
MFDEDEISQQREEAERLKQRCRRDDIQWLMGDQRGRRIAWKQLVDSRFESRSTLFDTHGGRQNYYLGMYEVGRQFSDEIRDLCPEQYLLMVRENTPKTDEVAP